jgi:NAD(P)-dependent dehydrogenase (short-subunit alcohol dehydrogenase family)
MATGLLDGRVAIVTGGAGNLGAPISRLCAEQGAVVVVNDVNADAGARVAHEIAAAGGRAVVDSTDVSTVAGGRALVQRTVDEFGTVDALILLAGRIPLSPLADVSEDEWDGVIDSHLKGHFTLIQAAAPVMKEKRYGRVVGFASVQGTIGDSHQMPYCAAKSGIIGLMRAVTIELDPFGVCANTVCPAGVVGAHGPNADRLVGPSRKVAPLVAYLASEHAGWINGHVFDISGSGRLGLYRPMVPERLIEQPNGFTIDEIGDAVVRLFEPMYSSEPRQRPRLLPPAGEQLDRLPEGISPLLYEMLSTAGLFPKPEKPPRTPWR